MNLILKGELMPDDWTALYREFGYTDGLYCPQDVRSAIGALPEGEELVLEINSVGGSVDAAAEIYSLLQNCRNPTRAVIQSLAASAASYMILPCNRIEISRPAQIMIHQASMGEWGNKRNHAHAARVLDAADRSILSCYAARCGEKCSAEELDAMMEDETWLTAEDAVRIGLADAIYGETAEPEGTEPVLLTACVAGNVVRAMRTLPDVRELMARREAQEDRERLELEKRRYAAPGL